MLWDDPFAFNQTHCYPSTPLHIKERQCPIAQMDGNLFQTELSPRSTWNLNRNKPCYGMTPLLSIKLIATQAHLCTSKSANARLHKWMGTSSKPNSAQGQLGI